MEGFTFYIRLHTILQKIIKRGLFFNLSRGPACPLSATWPGALSRSHGTWAHHKKREGGRAEVQENPKGEKRCYLHGSLWCTFRLADATARRSPILPDAAGCEPCPLPDAATCQANFCRMLVRSLVPLP